MTALTNKKMEVRKLVKLSAALFVCLEKLDAKTAPQLYLVPPLFIRLRIADCGLSRSARLKPLGKPSTA